MKYKTSQQGATLIVVLIILLFMTIIGTLAIRQSLVSLNIATNGQAQQLMLQSSDAAIFQVEDPTQLTRYGYSDSLLGYPSKTENIGKEIVFCYRGTQSSFFDFSKISVMEWLDGDTAPTGTTLGSQGYCSVGSSSNDFTSGRQAVMTQVTIQFVNSESSRPFENALLGTDTQTTKLPENQKAIIHAVSLMPTLSSASDDSINTCLSKRMSNPVAPSGVVATGTATQTVSQCLAALNVPFTTQVTDYNYTFNISTEQTATAAAG
ncbi:pilus assembly protein PilX [Serratia sp. S1B]|nr:pilus assembly protein PilX [Serratia sp. S1B]